MHLRLMAMLIVAPALFTAPRVSIAAETPPPGEVTDAELEAASQTFEDAMLRLETEARKIWEDQNIPEVKRRKAVDKLADQYQKSADSFADLYDNYLIKHPPAPDAVTPAEIRATPHTIIREVIGGQPRP